MKISKKAVLAMGCVFTLASLGLMVVFAENAFDVQLNVDPNNAIQHFQGVKIISTGNNDESYAIINKKGKLIGIDTDNNFILTRTGIDLVNQINKGVTGSSILGGTGNKIEKGMYNEIMGGEGNKIEEGKNNSILGGSTNVEGNGHHSVILGGKENEVKGSYSSIVGGEGNEVTKAYAMAVGNNNVVSGQNSVAMGSGSKVEGQRSFLWTDGENSDEFLEYGKVFVVKGRSGMVVNTIKAHSLAQLTVSGSLIVYDNKKTLECTEDMKGVLRVIDGDVYNNKQKCFCSCDGSGRNALHEGTRCEALCNNGTGLQAECGEVRVNCETNPYSYTGAGESGACLQGELVRGTGAFLVDTHSDDTEWIHRSCQTSYGQVTGCQQQLTGESCPNLRTGHECVWDHEELTGHLITNPNSPINSASFWRYDPELGGPCTYKCDQYGEWDPIQGKCIFHSCTGELPEGAKLNDEMALPMNDTTHYSYDAELSGACIYSCNREYGYYYSGALNKCLTCPEGQIYNESDGTCKVACDMSSTSFGTITIMDDSGYAITIADRNLGALSNDIGKVSSYGCYFQRGNNYGFQPVGALETSMEFADTRGYGPGNPYSSHIFRVRASMSGDSTRIPVFGPNDDDWSSPANDNLWGGANDSSSNAFGVLDSDKENRQGPCPEGYHVPSIGERNDLLIMWYNKEYKADGLENLQYIKDSGKIANFRSGGISSLGKVESIELVKAFRDYFLLPPAGSRTFIDFAPGVTYGHGGSFWTSSSPWLSGSFSAGSLPLSSWIRDYPNVANSFDYNIESREGYVGHGTTGRKRSAQSVRCFKDVPECPSGKVWNQDELRCESVTDCDVENTAIQDLELFFIASSGDISHYMMMDRNLGAFEVYNQMGEANQNAGSLGCHFQWGNNYGFHLGTSTTRYGINPSAYGPGNYYSNNKFMCYSGGTSNGGELGDEDDIPDDQGDEAVYGSIYSPYNYHMWGGGYILYNRVFRTGYGDNGTDEDRRGPCPEGYHVPGGIEMDDFLDNWNDASISQGSLWEQFASDLLMPFGRYIEVWCGRQNRLRVGGGIWLSDMIYKNYGGAGGGHYMNHIDRFTSTGKVGFSRHGFAYGFPVRCVKNGMSTSPQKVTIHADGGTGAVISIDWETEGTGKITALGIPTKNGINFLGWYSNSSFAAEFKVDTGDYISSGGHLYARWDGCNIADTAVQDLEVFFLLSPTRISHYMMMDRNLGATEAFNQEISSPNEESYGCYFQWGNNYPFKGGRTGSSYTTGTLTDTEDYGPGRSKGYYYNSVRYCVGGGSGMYPYANKSAGVPLATRFWGGGWIRDDGITYDAGSDGTDIDRQGPCPVGYHIPRGVEMENIMSNWKVVSNYKESDSQDVNLGKSKKMASDLLLPFAGWNGEGCSELENHYLGKGTFGKYLISDYYKFSNNHLHIGKSSDPDGIFLKGNGPAYGLSMRCVKNNISVVSPKVTIYADGGTGAVIAIDWTTADDGKIVTLGEPKKDGYYFDGWYSNQAFTTEIKVGDRISNGGDLYAKWTLKECDVAATAVQDLDIYILSDTGSTSHYMMMDRNLGAKEVYNQNYSSANEGSYGCDFQWGNNYGFNRRGYNKVFAQEALVNVTGYGPSNPYYSETFICNTDEETGQWTGGRNMDLWGGVTDTDISKKGPCPDGYHVPSAREMQSLVNKRQSAINSGGGIQFRKDILVPPGIALSPRCDETYSYVEFGTFWLADLKPAGCTCACNFNFSGIDVCTYNGVAHAFHVRCVKNNLETNPQKITIHADGGTGTVISIDWETEGTGKITTLGTPKKGGVPFLGWYSDEGFTKKVNTGDYISNGGHLYAKWNECKANETKVQDLEIYLLSSTGTISQYTMMDRNLGAKQVFNQNFSSPNELSYGCYYQWGNNYGFPAVNKYIPTTSETLTDPENYGPNRQNGYYSNPKRFCYEDYIPMYPRYNNYWEKNFWLWGGGLTNYLGEYGEGLGSDGSDIDRRGPCPEGYHIPRGIEMENIINEWKDSLDAAGDSKDESQEFASNLLLPFAGYNSTSCSINMYGVGLYGRYNISDYLNGANHLRIGGYNNEFRIGLGLNGPAHGFSMRCVKNNISANQKITIHPDGGTGAVIAIDWESGGTGKIMTLGQPAKTGYTFDGRYTDEGFTNRVNTGDYVYSGGELYVKWTKPIAIFMIGKNFNDRIKLSYYGGSDTNIRSIMRSYSEPPSGVRTGLISDTISPIPIIFWYKNGTIYYYTEADEIYLNENSEKMFEGLSRLTSLDMSGWNTSNVSDMNRMFYGCNAMSNLDLSNWDTSNVTNMNYMFAGCSSLTNLNLSGWNTSNVKDMSYMFSNSSNFTGLDLSNFDTSSVTDMNSMFNGCSKLSNLNLSGWNTSNVKDMNRMFYGCKAVSDLDLSNFDTSNVTGMNSMFRGCTNLTNLKLSGWNTDSLIDTSYMFYECGKLSTLNLSHFNTENVTTMKYMFGLCSGLNNLNLSGWDTSSVSDMSYMFYGCSKLPNLDVTHFDTSNVTNMASMFNGCSKLTNLDVTHFNTSNVTNMNSMFDECSKLTNLDVTHFDTSNVTNMGAMFERCSSLTSLDVTHFDTSNVTNMYGMFNVCSKLTSLDVTQFDTSNVTSMRSMFRYCSSLTGIDVTHFDTSNVTSMMEMFMEDSELLDIDLSNFDTSNVTDMREMFRGDRKLSSLDLSHFNTSNVRDMGDMFRGCIKLSNLNTNGWDTSNVTNMDGMFNACGSFINLDLKHFNTSKVGTMASMFNGCSSLTGLDVSNWDTINNTNLYQTFQGCKSLTNLDLSSWDTRGVTSMGSMFSGCTNLRTVYVGSKFRTDNVKDSYSNGMFYNDINLIGGNGTIYDSNFIDKTYARIDTGAQPGYFTKSGATDKSIAYLLPGKLFNTTVKSLSIGNTTADKLITKLEKANSLPIGATTITISDTGSDAPIYAWFDNGILYYHTTADIIEANSDLSSMFAGFEKLTEFDFGDWDISNVRNVNYMFGGCSGLIKLDLSNLVTDKWDVNDISHIYDICYGKCNSLTELNLSGWNLVSDYRYTYNTSLWELLFGGTPPPQLKKLNLSNVKINGGLNKGSEECGNIEEIVLDGIDTSQVTDMNGMFGRCTELSTVDVSYLDTSNVTDMKDMFRHCYNLTGLDLSTWNTSKVTNMEDMFSVGDSKLETIYVSTGFITDQIGNEPMFTAKALVGGNGTKYEIITSAYVNMSTTKPNDKTFAKIDNHSQSGYFTNKNEITVRFMVGQGEKYTEQVVKFGDRATMPTINPSKPGATFEKWVTKDGEPYNFNNKIYKYTELYAKFNSEEATLLQGSKFNLILKNLSNPTMDFTDPAGSHVYNIQTLKRWTGDNIPSGVYTGILSAPYSDNEIVAWYNAGIVYYYTVANTIYLNEDSSFMFYGLGGLKDLNLSNWNTDKTNNMNYMFGTCTTLTNLNLSGWDTSNVKNMSYMFYNCNNLTSLDVTHFKTKNTTNMHGMFSKCNNLTRLNLNEWETNNVNDMSYMFNECSSLTGLDLSNFNTNNVTNMSYMFNKGNNLTSLNLNGWNTSKVIGMDYMFNECSNLVGLDVSRFNTSNVTNMAYMFYKCASLTGLDLNSWDTSNVTNMIGMFYDCSDLTELDIANFNTNKVTNMGGMFYGCKNLTELDIANFNTNNVSNMYNMFGVCSNLKTIYASTGFITDNIGSSDTSYMFQNNVKLVGGNGTRFDISHNNKTYARIDQPGIPGYFTSK